MNKFFEGSQTVRHCSQVIAFEKDGAYYIKCRCCKKWVKLQTVKETAPELLEGQRSDFVS